MLAVQKQSTYFDRLRTLRQQLQAAPIVAGHGMMPISEAKAQTVDLLL